jgi:hypothetical protein
MMSSAQLSSAQLIFKNDNTQNQNSKQGPDPTARQSSFASRL